MAPSPKQYLTCSLLAKTSVDAAVFRLDFDWPGPAPGAGQFFMVRALRGGSFLGRPLSVYRRDHGLSFLIQKKGRGTMELGQLEPGEQAALTGPLGNKWKDFIPGAETPGPADKAGTPGKIALVGGGVGIAPLAALAAELGGGFDFYAGFRSRPFGLESLEEKADLLLVASEDGSAGRRGRIPDFFTAENYRAVCACGPEPMLRALAEQCGKAGVPCYVSMEQRMACGAGACLGCTVKTAAGNRRCCADGPIFPAGDVFFEAPPNSGLPSEERRAGPAFKKEEKAP